MLFREVRWFKVVRTRKEHRCNACGGVIRSGDLAIVEYIKYTRCQRYPDINYYHYLDGINIEEFKKWSFRDIRNNICSKIPYIWETTEH